MLEFFKALIKAPLALTMVLGVLLIVYGSADKLTMEGLTIQAIAAFRVPIVIIGIMLLVGPPISVLIKMRNTDGCDAFLAFPMAAFSSDEEYKLERAKILVAKTRLTEKLKLSKIYFAGENIQSMAQFETAVFSAAADLDMIDKCKFFFLVYPQKIPSSVLFEAGYALAKKKRAIYFVPQGKDLPFMMQKINVSSKYVKIIEYGSDSTLEAALDANKVELLKWVKRA